MRHVRALPGALVLSLAACLGGASAAIAAPVVGDASFENPTLPAGGYAYQPAGSAWTFGGNSGLSHVGGPFFSGAAPGGSQAAFMQTSAAGSPGTPGTISQMITGLTIGVQYSVGFFLASRNESYAAADPVTVTFGGVELGTFTNPTFSFAQEMTSMFYTATAGSALLAFHSNATGGPLEQDAAIDLVTVQALSPLSEMAVPEPASLALLGFGAAGVLAARRRRATARAVG